MPWDEGARADLPGDVRLVAPEGRAGNALVRPVVAQLRGLGVGVTHGVVGTVDDGRAALLKGEADMAIVPVDPAHPTPHTLECAAVPRRLDPHDVAWVSPHVATRSTHPFPWSLDARVAVCHDGSSPRVGIPWTGSTVPSAGQADVVIMPAFVASAWVDDGAQMAWTRWDAVPLDPTKFVPRTGQGAAFVEIRRDDVGYAALATSLHDRDAYRQVSAEVGAVSVLEDVGLAAVTAFASTEGPLVRLHVAWRRPSDATWRHTTVVHPSSEGVGFLARIDVEATLAAEDAPA